MADFPNNRGGGLWATIGAVISGNSRGTLITAGSADTDDGSWSEIEDSTPFDADGFYLNCDVGGGTLATGFLFSLAIGASGAEKRIIDRLLLSRATDTDGPGQNCNVWFPIPIPAGTRISGRCQSGTASATMNVVLHLRMVSHFQTSAPLGILKTYGVVDSGATGGTACNASAIHTRAWTEIVASATYRSKLLYLAIGNRNNTARPYNNWSVSVARGASGAENNNIVFEHLIMLSSTGDDLIHASVLGPFPCDINAGDRVAVGNRSQTNDGTDRQFDAAIYLLS